MKELIFFDVDDTLLDSRTHKIPKSTITTLQEMASYYEIGIATGRSLSTLLENGVAEAFEWAVYVCNNGQLVYDKNKEVCYSSALSADIVKSIMDTAQACHEPLLAGIPRWCQIGTPNQSQMTAHSFFHMDIPKEKLPKDATIYMFVAFGEKDSDYDKYRNIPGVQVMIGQSSYCDIIKENSGKDAGIEEVLKLFHQDSYIAFGDSDNDITMFKKSRYAIAMGQGSDFAKANADFVTKPVYEDGIAYAWKHCPLFQKHHIKKK